MAQVPGDPVWRLSESGNELALVAARGSTDGPGYQAVIISGSAPPAATPSVGSLELRDATGRTMLQQPVDGRIARQVEVET